MYKCGRIYVNLNGAKGPNKDGYDIFGFTFYQNTITPMGMKNDHNIENFKICIGTSSYSPVHNNGGTCTAWALQNENLDYLHCPEKLSWDGQKTYK